jgi:16S rRNA (cytosine1402-N4)-methyltransferase
MMYHEPVMVNEVIQNLKAVKNKTIVDCTLGDGGHSIQILKEGFKVIGIDYNDSSISRTTSRLENLGLLKNFEVIKGNFKDLDTLITASVDGFLLDLGYSSFHLEGYQKGVSFQKDEELDMRIDTSLGIKAKDLINALNVSQLEYIFKTFGEEVFARKIAEAIVSKRAVKEIHSTSDLVEIISRVIPSRHVSKINPATKVFQSLRIVVNGELDNLKTALPKAENLTLPGGRILIITFHSLEDKIVREFARDFQPSLILVGGTFLTPTKDEVLRNPRSRSAKLYVFEKRN